MRFKLIKRRRWKVILIIFVVIILTVILNPTKAKYRTTQRIPLVRGTISYSLADLNVIAVKVKNKNGEYENSDRVPEKGYSLNTELSQCEVKGIKDNTIEIEYNNGLINFLNVSHKGTKCYLYFDEKLPSASEIILAHMNTITTRSSFSSKYESSTTGTIFTAEDNDGISYYFAGAPTDNWIKFGGFYWRIIRINGDGSIRMIYQGDSANITGDETKIGTSAYNTDSSNNMHVGYMYTNGSGHGYGTSSTIKNVLDTWYINDLENYADYIDKNAGFCNDRKPSTSNSSSNGAGGTGTTTTYYAAYIRLNTNNPLPTLKCSDSSDLFTPNGSNKGNKYLANPIGLITMDEVVYAGGLIGIGPSINTEYYLYTNYSYWTMTPNFYMSEAIVEIVQLYGIIEVPYVDNIYGVRPVINLRSDVTFNEGGTDTSTNPYVITGAE